MDSHEVMALVVILTTTFSTTLLEASHITPSPMDTTNIQSLAQRTHTPELAINSSSSDASTSGTYDIDDSPLPPRRDAIYSLPSGVTEDIDNSTLLSDHEGKSSPTSTIIDQSLLPTNVDTIPSPAWTVSENKDSPLPLSNQDEISSVIPKVTESIDDSILSPDQNTFSDRSLKIPETVWAFESKSNYTLPTLLPDPISLSHPNAKEDRNSIINSNKLSQPAVTSEVDNESVAISDVNSSTTQTDGIDFNLQSTPPNDMDQSMLSSTEHSQFSSIVPQNDIDHLPSVGTNNHLSSVEFVSSMNSETTHESDDNIQPLILANSDPTLTSFDKQNKIRLTFADEPLLLTPKIFNDYPRPSLKKDLSDVSLEIVTSLPSTSSEELKDQPEKNDPNQLTPTATEDPSQSAHNTDMKGSESNYKKRFYGFPFAQSMDQFVAPSEANTLYEFLNSPAGNKFTLPSVFTGGAGRPPTKSTLNFTPSPSIPTPDQYQIPATPTNDINVSDEDVQDTLTFSHSSDTTSTDIKDFPDLSIFVTTRQPSSIPSTDKAMPAGEEKPKFPRSAHHNIFGPVVPPGLYPYSAKPLPHYLYSNSIPHYGYEYLVDDVVEGNHFGHSESREGDDTRGRYFVLLPDGRLQTVTYYANRTGYYPKVVYSGTAKHPLPIKYPLKLPLKPAYPDKALLGINKPILPIGLKPTLYTSTRPNVSLRPTYGPIYTPQPLLKPTRIPGYIPPIYPPIPGPVPLPLPTPPPVLTTTTLKPYPHISTIVSSSHRPSLKPILRPIRPGFTTAKSSHVTTFKPAITIHPSGAPLLPSPGPPVYGISKPLGTGKITIRPHDGLYKPFGPPVRPVVKPPIVSIKPRPIPVKPTVYSNPIPSPIHPSPLPFSPKPTFLPTKPVPLSPNLPYLPPTYPLLGPLSAKPTKVGIKTAYVTGAPPYKPPYPLPTNSLSAVKKHSLNLKSKPNYVRHPNFGPLPHPYVTPTAIPIHPFSPTPFVPLAPPVNPLHFRPTNYARNVRHPFSIFPHDSVSHGSHLHSSLLPLPASEMQKPFIPHPYVHPDMHLPLTSEQNYMSPLYPGALGSPLHALNFSRHPEYLSHPYIHPSLTPQRLGPSLNDYIRHIRNLGPPAVTSSVESEMEQHAASEDNSDETLMESIVNTRQKNDIGVSNMHEESQDAV